MDKGHHIKNPRTFVLLEHLPKLHLTHKSLNHTMSGMSYIVTPEYRRVTTYTKTNTPTNTNNVYYRLGDLE